MVGPPYRPGLIDTNIVIDALRSQPAAVRFLAAVRAVGPPTVSIVTSMELVAGARNARDLPIILRFLSGFAAIPITPTVSTSAFALMQTYRLSHGLDIPDALIAATALELGLPLYTLNDRHFTMIPALTVQRPY